MSSDLPDSAVNRVPSWLWYSKPSANFDAAKQHARTVDTNALTRRVRPMEKHLHTAPTLLDVHHLAGPGVRRRRFEQISAFTGPRLRGPMTPFEAYELRKRSERAIANRQVIDAFNLSRLQTTLADQSELPQVAENVFEELLAFPMEEPPNTSAFPHSSVHVVRRSAALFHRVKMASVLLRVEHDPDLAAGNTAPIKTALEKGQLVFSASENLVSGVAFLDLYFGPLLGALSPAVWGFHTPHEIGMVLYSVGRPISGSRSDAAEMLHLLPSVSPSTATPFPELPELAAREALDWWATRLNALFGVITNPAVFTDPSELYVPVKHIQGISTA